ncbi:complex I NDUFA9 subunit family protein [Alphaproteobacteria bacterium]|nr:complex I NDUFA9 subunit family protein [Alphaproteobacteria bacterium]
MRTLQGKVFAIIGGDGFLGSHLIQSLATEGACVKVLCRYPQRARHLQPLGNVGQITPLFGDISSPESCYDALSGVDGIVNFAALHGAATASQLEAVHVTGPEAIAQFVKKQNIGTFIHLSITSAHNPEEASFYTPFVASKRAGEKAVKDACPKATIIRPSLMFGADDKLFNAYARLAQFSPVLPLLMPGETKVSHVDVDDVASAIAHLLNKNAFQGETFSLQGPRDMTFEAVIQQICRFLGRRRHLISLSSGISRAFCHVAGFIPHYPLGKRQLSLLSQDHGTEKGTLTFKDLSIDASPLEEVMPAYLNTFRKCVGV